jgi:uncharacterized protein (TIGR03382 family)
MSVMMRLGLTLLLATLASVNVVHAQAPQRLRVPEVFDPGVTYAVNSNVIFMHKCVGSSCTVRRASTNSTTSPDQSSIICRTGTACAAAGQGTLSQFTRSQAVWDQTMACIREVFAPFNVVITDVDPGSAPHYEIMVGGTPGQLGFGQSTGGVSPVPPSCGELPNSLVFVFDVWGNDVNELCATAAQEIAHSWSLDHVTDASDPMTYFPFASRRRFKDAPVTCGSDCEDGFGPNGQQCSGNGLQTRQCDCTGPTQNSVQMIKALFGTGTPTPPTVGITMPMPNQSVYPGFPVVASASDDMGIREVELYVDGELVDTQEPPPAFDPTKPYELVAPDQLAEGPHTIKVTAYDVIGTPTSASITITIAPPCSKPADCPNNTDTCIASKCVPGPGVQGGLGSECTDSLQCASGLCAMTTDGAYCVSPCLLGDEQCPSGFGCLDTGNGDGNGVCFPGFDEGGGCLDAGGSGGPITAGLGFAALLFVRRRRSGRA